MASKKREVIEEIGVVMGLVSVQFLYAGNAILLSIILKTGLQPSSLIICSTFATFLVLSPLAILFERHEKMAVKDHLQACYTVAFTFVWGVVFQSLFMKGVHLTSPAVATAMPNLAPGLIFFIACGFGLERMDIGCKYSRAKIGGTMLCVLGAVVMSLMQSDHSNTNTKTPTDFNSQTILGCTYLIAAVFVLSTQVVLQAITLRDFSAPISMCSITSLLGSMLTAVVEVVLDENYWDWDYLHLQDLLGYSIVAGGISGMCISVNAWAMKKRGPVVVSIFNPLGTVISAATSISLGDSISAKDLAGMLVMFSGLYLVLWAKRNESNAKSPNVDHHAADDTIVFDIEKPLLT
ncbi:hypothetical protein SASPL_116152 [Salvia splendens]|uniref:WAT1-related protein n=1 Tax=Salvia splendens TaxID=180675 RepID=A0A8X8Y3U1_SALSN|nr:hypothetical protein SASPL_116152 [Salvia splendens]